VSRTRNGRPDRTRAIIETPIESETPLGGRETVWSEAGVLWLAVDSRGLRERPEGESRVRGAPRLVETARVCARAHPAVRRGVRLATGDGVWRVAGVEPDRPGPGRMMLHLQRD
jgi:hypothetical protein